MQYIGLALMVLVCSGCSLLGSRGDTPLPVPEGPPSSRFEWRIDTLGDFSSSATGVEILSDSNICVSGTMFTYNEQKEYIRYNALHWNGKEWELRALPAKGSSGNISPQTTKAVFSLNNTIWFGTSLGSYIQVFDTDIKSEPYPIGSSRGSTIGFLSIDSSSYYKYGSDGSLTLANTEPLSFELVETGTYYDITSGALANDTLKLVTDNNQGSYQIVVVTPDTVFFELEDTFFTPSGTSMEGPFVDVWSDGRQWFYATNGGVYTKTGNDYSLFTPRYAQYISGNAPNDIFFTHFYGQVLHWNGETFNEVQTPLGSTHSRPPTTDEETMRVRAVDVTEEVICIVGELQNESRIVIMTGRRVEE